MPKSELQSLLYMKPQLYQIPGLLGRHPLPEIWSLASISSSSTTVLKALCEQLEITDVSNDPNHLESIIRKLYNLNRLKVIDRLIVEYPIFYQLMQGHFDDQLRTGGVILTTENRIIKIEELIRIWMIRETLFLK
jgi:hypothetical protein